MPVHSCHRGEFAMKSLKLLMKMEQLSCRRGMSYLCCRSGGETQHTVSGVGKQGKGAEIVLNLKFFKEHNYFMYLCDIIAHLRANRCIPTSLRGDVLLQGAYRASTSQECKRSSGLRYRECTALGKGLNQIPAYIQRKYIIRDRCCPQQ